MDRDEAIKLIRKIPCTIGEQEALRTLIPGIYESEDEQSHKRIEQLIRLNTSGAEKTRLLAYLEKQKEQKPRIQDVELNDAVYDYVRDHFIAGADFTPEYIKKLMENAFFAGVDYYLLQQESESCKLDTNVEKVIEDVIRVYEKTQGEWVGGYDVDTLIVNLRRAFNKKEQKPAPISCGHENGTEWSEEDEKIIRFYEADYNNQIDDMSMKDVIDMRLKFKNWLINRLKSLRPSWKPSEEQIKSMEFVIKNYREDGCIATANYLQEICDQIKKL